MSSPTLLIAGAGIAGLTAALCALRAGFHVTVTERAPRLSEVGAGLQLGPNAMRVMAALGLDATVRAAGHEPLALAMRDGPSGRELFSIPAGVHGGADWGAPHVNIRRAALQAILLNAFEASPRASLLLDSEAVDYREGGAGIVLTLASGDELTGAALIAADGLRSALRARLLQGQRPRYTGNTAWRTLVPATEALLSLIPDASTVWTGPGRHAVTYYLRDKRLINFVGAVERTDPEAEGWDHRGDLAQLRADFAGFAEPVRAVLAAAGDAKLWGLYDRPPPARISQGAMALVGDAAFPMPPFMAQGAGHAMECAWTAVWDLKTTGGFRAYEKQAMGRGVRLLETSRRNADLFHGRALPAMFGYRPVEAVARIMPRFVRSRFGWIYRYDATAGRPV